MNICPLQLSIFRRLSWLQICSDLREIGCVRGKFFSMSHICNEMCSKPKIFLAFLSKLLCFSFILALVFIELAIPFLMHLPVEKHKIIIKNGQLKYNYQCCFKIDAIFTVIYKQNLLNFRHHFLFGVSSKISSF
jgi:hypothetical protein